jgi:hypothetical protein
MNIFDDVYCYRRSPYEKAGLFLAGLVSYLGLTAMTLVFIAAGTILRGYVLSILWNWFIVPLHVFPAINFVLAIGICIVSGLLHPTSGKSDNLWNMLVGSIINSFCFLGIGYVVHLFM